MTTQKEAYEGDTRIKSEPTGLLSRANRCHYRKQDKIIQATAAENGDPVLEVGSGHGIHSQEYAARFDLTAIDISRSLVDETRRSAPEARCLVADGRDLPLPDRCFKAVVGTAIAHHLPDVGQALEEWARVVENGGSVTLAEPNYLFPKDFITAHTVPEERHKTQMAPWRIRSILDDLECSDWSLRPFNHTPPLPRRLSRFFDRIDAVAEQVPGARWTGQMLLIHVEV